MKREWRRLFCGFAVIVSLGVGSPILCGVAEDVALAANTSAQAVAASDQTHAVMDGKLQVNAMLVLTPRFCETKWGVEDRLPLDLGQRVCKGVESDLKGFFSSVTVVQDTPAPGVAQIVLRPRFPEGYEGRTVFSGTRKHATVWLEWKVTDGSGTVVWIGKVQGEVKHPIGSLVGVWPRAVQEAAQDLAQQSGPKISSAPEVRNFARLLLAKSSLANSPAAAAAAGELFQAARDSDSAKVAALLKDNPGLASAVNGDADAPLHVAASSGHKEVAELLLASHADVNAKDANGATPLHDAAYAGHKDVAELLLANKADVGAQDFKGATALHKAADQGHADLAELLLRHNADVGARDSSGQTPLLLAASAGHKDAVELLLANKAEVNLKNDKDTTPLYAAMLNGHTDVARLLLASGADPNAQKGDTPLHLAVKTGPRDLVELLLASKADVNARGHDEDTPLHLAVLAGNKDIVELLLANKAAVNLTGHRGQTALHEAAGRGSKEIAELLLANKADVDARDGLGNTPLYEAGAQGHKDVAEALLAHNAEVNVQNYAGVTPLRYALAKGYQDVAELLRQRGGQDFAGFKWPEPELIGPPQKIVLLPVADLRADTHVNVDLERLRKVARKDLERKRYELIEANTPPPGERWVMTLNLINTAGRGVRSSSTVACVLKDQQSGLTQWRAGSLGAWQSTLAQPFSPDEVRQIGAMRAATVESMGQTSDILFATLMPGSAMKDALDRAVSNALQNIPTLPKAKKNK